MSLRTVAALYVLKDGPYANREGVDPWPESRDARLYAGPHVVVAHPPCARWGRYWGGGPMLARTPRQKKFGDYGGCFAAVLCRPPARPCPLLFSALTCYQSTQDVPVRHSARAILACSRLGQLLTPRSDGW